MPWIFFFFFFNVMYYSFFGTILMVKMWMTKC